VPITPPLSEAPIQYTIGDLCADALIETGAYSPGESNSDPNVLQWAFRKANELMDVWQAMRNRVYSYQFTLFTFPAGVNPVLMGPSPVANWSVPQRPVRLESAALILNAGFPVDLPINIRDKDWWARNQVKSIQTNVPTDVYPDYTWPDASLYFWPVINEGDQVRLQTWTTVPQFDSITDPIGGPGGIGTLPPAYRTAIKLTLAETLCPGLQVAVPPMLEKAALVARAAMVGPNAPAPRISLQDSGMPRSGRKKADFNWATGGAVGGRAE
jgi:hypothetical protein